MLFLLLDEIVPYKFPKMIVLEYLNLNNVYDILLQKEIVNMLHKYMGYFFLKNTYELPIKNIQNMKKTVIPNQINIINIDIITPKKAFLLVSLDSLKYNFFFCG